MTIKELHDNLYDQNKPVNPTLFMDIYEANLDLISQVDLTNLDDYASAMRMTCDYAIFLENSGYFLKGILYLEDAIEMMEKYPPYQKDQLFDIDYYELVVFHKALAFYNLQNYKDAKLIFKRLIKAFPDNATYQSWMLRIKVKKYENWMWIGLGVMLATLILRAFLKDNYPLFDQLAYWILILAFISTAICGIGKRIEMNKLKRMNAL